MAGNTISRQPTTDVKSRRVQRQPGRHYVWVEKDGKDFERSPLDDMLELASPTDAEADMYKVEVDRKKRVLMSCSIEDHAKAQAAHLADAAPMRIDPQAQGGSEFSRFEYSQGGVVSEDGVLEG